MHAANVVETGRFRMQLLAGIAAAGLHAWVIWFITRAPYPKKTHSEEPLVQWILLPALPTPTPTPAPSIRNRNTPRRHNRATPLAVPSVSAPVESPATVPTAHDWNTEALRAAGQVSGRWTADARRSSANLSKPRAPFPWTRAPLTPWFDFDPASFVTTLKLGPNCEISFLYPVATFGCPGQPPARGDLFDPKFAPEDATATLP